MKKIIYRAIIMLLIGVMLISSYFLCKNYKEDNEQEEILEELSNIVIKENNEEKEKTEDNINMKELYKINSDIVGWLKIEDTNINYPVMQSKERPDYYIRRNFYKDYSILRYTIYCTKL